MLLFGNIGEFVQSQESWMQYLERFEQFLRANEIVDEGKKAAIFLGPTAYDTPANFQAPSTPAQNNYSTLKLWKRFTVQNNRLLYSDTGSTVIFVNLRINCNICG